MATAPVNRRSRLPVDKPAPLQAQQESEAAPNTTAAYYLAFIVLGLVLAVLGPTLPYLAEQTGSQLSQVSILFAARSLGGFSGALLSSRLYDRRAGHPILLGTLVVFIMCLGLIPLIPALWLLAGLLFVVGVAEGVLDVGVNTLIVWVHGRSVGPFMNGLHFFFGLGAFLAPIIVAQVLAFNGDVRWAYWILALLVFPALFWIARLPSPHAPAARTDTESSTAARTDALIVFLIAVLLALYVGAEISFGGWIFSYTVAMGLAAETTAAYLTSLFWGTFTIGRLLAIPLARVLRPRAILLGDLGIAATSVALILLWPQSQVVVWLGTAGVGLSMASVFPTVLTLAERRMLITGTVTSMFFVGASVGGMTLPWLIGQLFTAIGPQMTMLAILVDLGLAMMILTALLHYAPTSETG